MRVCSLAEPTLCSSVPFFFNFHGLDIHPVDNSLAFDGLMAGPPFHDFHVYIIDHRQLF